VTALYEDPTSLRADNCTYIYTAPNILNKQSRTADKGCSSSLVVGQGANNPSP
jgi:hypothetical protein